MQCRVTGSTKYPWFYWAAMILWTSTIAQFLEFKLWRFCVSWHLNSLRSSPRVWACSPSFSRSKILKDNSWGTLASEWVSGRSLRWLENFSGMEQGFSILSWQRWGNLNPDCAKPISERRDQGNPEFHDLPWGSGIWTAFLFCLN